MIFYNFLGLKKDRECKLEPDIRIKIFPSETEVYQTRNPKINSVPDGSLKNKRKYISIELILLIELLLCNGRLYSQKYWSPFQCRQTNWQHWNGEI